MGRGTKWVVGIVAFCIAFLVVFCGVGGHSLTEIPVVGDLFSKKDIDSGKSYTPTKTSSPTSTALSADAKRAKLYSNAIEPRNSAVRSYALSAIKSSNSGDYNIGQICDIYDKLYKSWVYVNDPAGEDYVAKASESVKLLRGDCEDYAILMASCVEAIGGTARIISAKNANGEGHAYAEVWMTSDPSSRKSLTSSISKRYGGKTIYYHTESLGNGETGYWLNLDWTANHPGGDFFESSGKILIIRSNGNYEREGFTINN